MTWQGNFICKLIVFIVTQCSYMLSYLRQDKQKREVKDPFQELLQLLANRQKDDFEDQVGTIIVLFGKILMYTPRL